MTSLEDEGRFDAATRWPCVLRTRLGQGWHVIEEGLPGRTTVHDDPVEGYHKNGRRYLQACLESHRPLGVTVLMLGTNDLKARFNLPPSDVAAGMRVLAEIIVAFVSPPKLLIVCPPPIVDAELLGEMFAGGRAKSLALASHYRAVADAIGASFLDAGTVIRSSPIDGIHFDADAHRSLGAAIAEKVSQICQT